MAGAREPDPGDDLDLEIRIEAIAEEYLDQLQEGQTPDRQAIVAAHPDLADDLDSHLKLIEVMHGTGLPEKVLHPGPSRPLEIPESVGPYRVLRSLGVGGMGEVYLAEQAEPIRREVAVKLVKLGMDTREVVARFDTERQALAVMAHPNIAQVFDAGAAADGRPYFVMEYVAGQPITEFCDENHLSTAERLDLFCRVCDAIQHAHQKGVIHRDLKPSNVLVFQSNGTPMAKVIDFGVAKAMDPRLAERTAFTELGRLVGTPEYMSPEQADPDSRDVDTRTDVYSLGVILYELLVGAQPFDSGELREMEYEEIRRRIREDEPDRPSTRLSSLGDARAEVARRRRTDPGALARVLEGDLDWIAMKALEKDRDRRYAAASELAADIQRHLGDEPVEARPPSVGYRLVKLYRKRRGTLLAGAAGVLALVAGLAWSGLMWWRAEGALAESGRQQGLAEAEAEKATAVKDFLVGMLSSASPAMEGRDLKVADVLDGFTAEIDGNFAGQPVVRAELHLAAGAAYEGLGLYAEAERSRRTGLGLLEAELGEDHLETLLAARDLGTTLGKMGRYEEAEDLLRRALVGFEKTSGAEDVLTLGAKALLAGHIANLGRLGEASRIADDALQAMEIALGKDHGETALAAGVLASIRRDQGRLQEAKDLALRALEGNTRIYGEDHPRTLVDAHTYAAILGEVGLWTDLETIQRRIVEVSGRINGETHAETLNMQNALAVTLRRMGKYDEATRIYEEVLQKASESLGPDSELVAATAYNMGSLALRQGDYEEAERRYRQTLDHFRERYGRHHPETLRALGALAVACDELGRKEEAEALYREALEGKRAVLGDSHPQVYSTMGDLAANLGDQGRFDEAKAMARAAFEGFRDTLGSPHPRTIQAMNGLAMVFREAGEKEQAVKVWSRLVPLARKGMAAEDWRFGTYLRNYAYTLANLGQLREAEEAALEAMHRFETVLGPGSTEIRHTAKVLRDIYTGMNREDKVKEYEQLISTFE